VVSGVPSFGQTLVRREAELVALSSTVNATGLFQLDPQANLLRPFENLGVDTSWRLEMPKSANPFDFDTIADVLFTINYTALFSSSYRAQVLQELDRGVLADLGYSFRQNFADAWYQLNNPDPTGAAVSVAFQTESADFPPNVLNPTIAQFILYFVLTKGAAFEVQVTDLQFTPAGAAAPLDGGAAMTVGDVISTRRTNGSGWKAKFANPAAPVAPWGQWQLTLPNSAQTQGWFANQQIQDILVVITYSGTRPAWP
jgi:hypothetical protein